VRSYVNLIVKATQSGFVARGVNLLDKLNDVTGGTTPRAPMSDDIDQRRDYKMAVEAIDRILRSLSEPERREDYSTTTLSRLLVPLSAIVSSDRRGDTERFLLTSADQIISTFDNISFQITQLHISK